MKESVKKLEEIMKRSVEKLEEAQDNFIRNAESICQKEKTNVLFTVCVSESGDGVSSRVFGYNKDVIKALIFAMRGNKKIKSLIFDAVFNEISQQELLLVVAQKLDRK